MIFPKSTELPNKFIAKEKFYSNGDFTSKLKEAMTSDVARISAINQFSSSTLNIKVGENFPEIIVLKITLKNKRVDAKLLDAMDRSIRAAYILFILEYGDEYCASIGYKEKSKDSLNIIKRWNTSWVPELNFSLDGNSIDAIYENLIRQISDGQLIVTPEKDLKGKVAETLEQEKIAKKIEQLENKMNNEPQLKKKLEIKAVIKSLKEQL